MDAWTPAAWVALAVAIMTGANLLGAWLMLAFGRTSSGAGLRAAMDARLSKAEERIDQVGLRQHKVEAEFDVLNEKLFDKLAGVQRESFRLQLEAMDKFATKADLAAIEQRITHHIDALRETGSRRGPAKADAA
jgi:hypothetical protein